MDSHAITPDQMNLQSSLRFFHELAAECNTQCITDYQNKNLDNDEKACVKTCFKKQSLWNDKFLAA